MYKGNDLENLIIGLLAASLIIVPILGNTLIKCLTLIFSKV